MSRLVSKSATLGSIKFLRFVRLSFNLGYLLMLMQEHSGHVHFATDAWTSPNHRAFVAWTVHLHHNGHLLAFVLDIVEVPEVCSSQSAQSRLLT
jgi:hypothetical protein